MLRNTIRKIRVPSSTYRRILAELPGYDCQKTGDIETVKK